MPTLIANANHRLPAWLSQWIRSYDVAKEDPASLFHFLLISLVVCTAIIKALLAIINLRNGILRNETKQNRTTSLPKPASMKRLQVKYLAVFWLLRVSFWMNGPYFYAALASKTYKGNPLSVSMINQISLIGFAAIAMFGPYLGRLCDQYGRKQGTLLAVLLFGIGCWSIWIPQHDNYAILLLGVGKAIGALGSSMLCGAPESWFVSEVKKSEKTPWLGETFGMAYAMDSVMAIAAGQLAGVAARYAGPTGPFQLSPLFLLIGGFIATMFWEENKAPILNNKEESAKKERIQSALAVIRKDSRILYLGGVQAFFEAAMYIFVMAWPPTIHRAIQDAFGNTAATPFGTLFSCFMACCMLGSTIFGIVVTKLRVPLEVSTMGVLLVAAIAMGAASIQISNLFSLTVSYFVFETCVGMYFPAIGTLRSRFLPDSHRSVIMTLYGVPLNAMVVSVFLGFHKLGNVGSLTVASVLLGCGFVSMLLLYSAENKARRIRRAKLQRISKQLVLKLRTARNLRQTFFEAHPQSKSKTEDEEVQRQLKALDSTHSLMKNAHW